LSRVNLTLCHVAETVWYGSGVSRVTIEYEKSHCSPCICYFVSIWSQYF